jgi:hypothetical protein
VRLRPADATLLTEYAFSIAVSTEHSRLLEAQ